MRTAMTVISKAVWDILDVGRAFRSDALVLIPLFTIIPPSFILLYFIFIFSNAGRPAI